MAAYTSSVTGNWSSSSTWGGAGVPVSGDTVAIGAHTITVDAAAAFGTSPAGGNIELTVASGGTLAIASGITLTAKAGISTSDGTITMAAGGRIYFDSASATDPTNQHYPLRLNTADNQASSMTISGTIGAPCTVESNASGGYWYQDGGQFLRGGRLTASYINFKRGYNPATGFGWQYYASHGITYFDVDRAIMDGCNQFPYGTSNADAAANITWKNSTWKNTVSTVPCQFAQYDTPTGTRDLSGNVYDKAPLFYNCRGLNLNGSYYHEGYGATGAINWGSFTGCFVRRTSAMPDLNVRGDVTDGYWLYNDSSTINPHFMGITNTDTSTSNTINGVIFEFDGADANGDCIGGVSPSSALATTITNCIILPSVGGNCSGTGISLLGGANLTVVYEHNTVFAGSQGCAVGETYVGRANYLTFRSNIVYDTSARGYKLYDSGANDSVSDLVTSANANYNAGYNLLAGSNLKGYNNLEFSAGSPGANDVEANPQFVDDSRDIVSWDTSLGGAGTISNALTELRKRNDFSGYNTNYSVTNLLAYIRAGMAPTNSAFNGTAHDAGDIGAVAYVAAGGTTIPVFINHYRNQRIM